MGDTKDQAKQKASMPEAPQTKSVRDEINWWPLYVGLTFIVLAGAWYLIAHGLTYLAVILAAPLGWLGSRLLINGSEWLLQRKHEVEWEKWQGIHYAYGPTQLRALELEAALWFYEADLKKVLEIKDDSLTQLFPSHERRPHKETKGFILSEAGCEHLMTKTPSPEAKKLLLYLKRDVYFPYKRARGIPVEVPSR